MNEVKFKTLTAKKVHDKLMAVAERILVVEQVVDKAWNDSDTCHILPVLQDCQDDLAEVYCDMCDWKGDKLAVIGE